ncbi:MAG: hypothetical protein GTO45_29805 [Candidatus Aminicenantes bacterium]|nr:hypothetical protein [Candidatus Aminicenantes bacterium]NIM82989.1 hypothetical protein [Candidatus Aminicenantes bacterium]NIN22375.1 hypothetical protein [Candidatus Aminicenantes bacterium]NIN46135.1 hypothetical protein [Candidatus Aminicenantes bacterium]NIN88971.1 hypothetical protein [Candidatus Aminicenantes bacterium]
MSIWVRTQDKKWLVEVDSIQISGQEVKGFNNVHADGVILGKYSSEKSAVSVLNSIQNNLNSETGIHVVFEMPPDMLEVEKLRR